MARTCLAQKTVRFHRQYVDAYIISMVVRLVGYVKPGKSLLKIDAEPSSAWSLAAIHHRARVARKFF